MNAPREMTPGDRRELRSLIKKQFAVLRNDVKRREDELIAEIEAELLHRYREQDQRIIQANEAMMRARADYELALREIRRGLSETDPTLVTHVRHDGALLAQDTDRTERRRALLAAVPGQIADARSKLDQQELELLRELTVGALDSEQAQRFLGRIPTVGELVPKARLAELDGAT